MANTRGEKELRTDYPFTSGLGADDKHKGRQSNLLPEGILGVKTTIKKDLRVGLD